MDYDGCPTRTFGHDSFLVEEIMCQLRMLLTGIHGVRLGMKNIIYRMEFL